MNTWVVILIVASLVYGSRFLLMEPWVPLRLGKRLQKVLTFSAPAVLTAIAAPIVFIHNNDLHIDADNHYLLAAIVVVILAFVTKNTLITVLLGMASFLFLHQLL